MSSENNDERLHRLARVRDNQRKSRARKQQYIQELEQKVAVCNAQAQQRDIEHRIALQKLELENGKLRGLLNRLGYESGSLDQLLRGDSNPVTWEKIAIPALKKERPQTQSPTIQQPVTHRAPMNQVPVKRCAPKPSVSPPAASSTCGPPVLSASNLPTCVPATGCCGPVETTASKLPENQLIPILEQPVVPTCVPATGCCGPVEATAVKLPENQLNPILEQPVKSEASTNLTDAPVTLPPIASICDCGPASNSWPEVDNPLNTTLCGIAEDLIHQYNVRGVDINVIKKKLWAGFRNGTTDGCRVQNQVLFEVLDEISGSMR